MLGMQKPQGEARINCSGSAIFPVPPLTLNEELISLAEWSQIQPPQAEKENRKPLQGEQKTLLESDIP